MAVLDDAGVFGQKPVRAIFVDTCWEPTSVYRTLRWLRRKVSFPAFITHKGEVSNGLVMAVWCTVLRVNHCWGCLPIQ